MTTKELKEKIFEIETVCKKYNFLDKTVTPYGYPIKIGTLIKQWKELRDCYGLYDKDSYIYDEVTRLNNIVKSWEKFEEEPKIKIKLIAGDNKDKVKYVQQSIANCFIKNGFAIAL